MSGILETINSPADVRKLPLEALPELANELRSEIIRVIAKNGGHLGASLGTAELTVALHYVFDTPADRIVWDTGHQAHGHKILTRRQDFHTIRKKDGISGFPSRAESEYDTFGVGHASTAISAALGMAAARDISKSKNRVVAVVGDGALTGGIAFEAINNAGHLKTDLTVVLNDNRMSIAKNVGALSKYLTTVTSGQVYNRFEADVWELLGLIPKVGGKSRSLARRIKESIKNLIVPGIIFEELGFRYFGPIDGHNVEFLSKTLSDISKLPGPIMLHIVTEKGKGIEGAEQDSQRFHAVGGFDKIPGDKPKKKNGTPSYTSVFSKSLIKLAGENEKIVGITAAMPDGTGLTDFATQFEDRFFDVGIAEQHAVTFAAGLCCEGIIPIVAIYSTFLQRAYDQVIHDVALQKLPVRFVMDRGGLVGEDGPTHHGTLDVSYLRPVPNFVIMAPKDENELQHMLKTMVEYHDGPSALRFPRGNGLGVKMDDEFVPLPIGKSEVLRDGSEVVLIGYGAMVAPIVEAADLLARDKIKATVVNARFAKPLDEELLDSLAASEPVIITAEDNVRAGGYGSGVIEYLGEQGFDTRRIVNFGLPDAFVEHGPRSELLADVGLTAENFARAATEMLRSPKRPLRAIGK